MTQDPDVFVNGPNLYQMEEGSPVGSVDPTGLVKNYNVAGGSSEGKPLNNVGFISVVTDVGRRRDPCCRHGGSPGASSDRDLTYEPAIPKSPATPSIGCNL